MEQQYLITFPLLKNIFNISLDTKMKDSEKNIPLYIMLPKMSAYRTDFDETKYIQSIISIVRFGKDSAKVLKKDLTVYLSIKMFDMLFLNFAYQSTIFKTRPAFVNKK